MTTITGTGWVAACSASEAIMDATEKLDDMVVARNGATTLGLPLRQVAIDDIDAEVRFIEERLAVIKAAARKERERYGW